MLIVTYKTKNGVGLIPEMVKQQKETKFLVHSDADQFFKITFSLRYNSYTIQCTWSVKFNGFKNICKVVQPSSESIVITH